MTTDGYVSVSCILFDTVRYRYATIGRTARTTAVSNLTLHRPRQYNLHLYILRAVHFSEIGPVYWRVIQCFLKSFPYLQSRLLIQYRMQRTRTRICSPTHSLQSRIGTDSVEIYTPALQCIIRYNLTSKIFLVIKFQ